MSVDETRELRVEKDHIHTVLNQRQDFLNYRFQLYRMSDDDRASILVNRIGDSENEALQ